MAPAFHPFEVTIPHITYACLGGFIVLFGMFSLFLRERLYIGEACWAFLFGVIIGPYGANIFNPRSWGGDGQANEATTDTITLEFTRIVLAIGVFAIGVELPKAYMARHWKSLFFLLGPVMTWGWFVSAGLIYALIPGLNFLSSLAVAACLTPTDPILAAAVVGGKYADKHVPAHIRHLLAAESGCNDGAAFPFLYIALYLIIDSPSTGNAIKDWFLLLWLYQVVLGVSIGAALGFAFRYLMRFCQRHDLIDRHSYVAQYVSLAMLTIGVTTLLGSDDLLSAFACGTAFAWDGFFNRQTEESVFSSVIDLLFNIAAFVFVGAWMPFSSFADASLTLSVWRLIVIAILVLLLRRLPVMIALYKWIPDVKTFREAVFSGHFGPIGVGAVFISTLAAEVLHDSLGEEPVNEQNALLANSIQPIVAFMVLCSITIHGLSIPGFSLGKRVHTVSRTWSRAASILPDWTNQARVVERGQADIVINRDPERQQSDIEKVAGSDDSATQGKEETPSPPSENAHLPVSEPKPPAGEEPPDGREILGEWQEGPHRIIERRAGPGEEVEVEVIKHYHDPNVENASEMFQGTHANVHDQVNAYLAKLRATLEHDLEKVDEGLEKVKDILRHSPPLGHHHHAPAGSISSVIGGQASADDDGDDAEDEWGSETDADAEASTSTEPHKERSRSPKTSPTHSSRRRPPKLGTAPPPRKGKRRSSMRRGVIGALRSPTSPTSPPFSPTSPLGAAFSPTSPDRSSAVFEDSDTDEPRGRLSITLQPPAEGSSPHTSRPGSLRHFRIDSLRSPPLREREHSPARSVRFEEPSTPKRGDLEISRPGTPSGDTHGGGGTNDDSKGKVTFELPPTTKH